MNLNKPHTSILRYQHRDKMQKLWIIYRSLGSVIFILVFLLLLFNKNALNWLKEKEDTFILLQKKNLTNAVLLIFICIKKYKIVRVSTKILSSTTVLIIIILIIIIINVSWATNQHEGSCDTEVYWNSALHHRNKLHFKIYSHRK